MRASLVSREVIADSIELVARGHLFDGLVCLVACDKTNPGGGDGGRRGSTSRPRPLHGLDRARPLPRSATSRSATSTRGSARTRPGRSRADDLHELESVACPAAGACGGQFTANTMSTILEFLGLSPFGANDIPAIDTVRRRRRRRRSGASRSQLVRDDVTPSQIVTKDVVRERRRLGRGDGRLDERRPPPRRDRAGLRDRLHDRRLRARSRRGRRSSPT